MKVFVIVAVFLALAAAEPEPEPYYGYGYGFHQQAWPGVRVPGFSATCYGCRGKRSAEPEPYYGYGYGLGYGYGHHGYGAVSYTQRSPQGLRGKRSAEPEPFYGYYGHPFVALHPAGPLATAAGPTGIAAHPTGTSYSARSPQGLRGKRSAEPFYGYGFPYHGYGYARGYGGPLLTAAGPTGIAGHAGGGSSFVARSPQGVGK